MDKPEITQEMIEAYQRQKAEAEQQRRHALIKELAALAEERGYQIIAVPQLAPDGHGGHSLAAVWGVQAVE